MGRHVRVRHAAEPGTGASGFNARLTHGGEWNPEPQAPYAQSEADQEPVSMPTLPADIIDGRVHVLPGTIETDKLAADVVVANVANVGDTVVIDETGITITDGAITLQDYAGESVLTAFGFKGAWLGFLADGVYNSSFDVGVTGTDLTNNNLIPDTTEEYEETLSTELPGWHILKGDPNPGRLRLMTDTDALGGFALRFDNAAADANSRLASVFQDIPVLPGDELAVVLRWRYGASGAGNEVTRNITYSFVDADHEALTSLTSDGQIYSDSSDYATLVFPITDVVPNTARYLRLSVGFGCQGAGAALIDAIRLIRTNLEGMSLVSVGHSGGNTVEIDPDAVTLLGSSILLGPAGGSPDVALIRLSPNILFLNNGDIFDVENLEVRRRMSLTTVIQAPQITANQNNYNPTGFDSSGIVRISSDAARQITGLQAGTYEGEMMILMNTGGFTITLVHNSASSSAANRIFCPGSVNYSLLTNSCVLLVWGAGSSVWRIIGA